MHSVSYLVWITFISALFSYFVTFNNFGFPPNQLLSLVRHLNYKFNSNDIYNPTHPTFGNTLLL